VKDLKNWAREGAASDLMYLFCHARPARYDDTSDGESWLGFGLSESDDSSEARAGIGELRELRGGQRPTNPVVILNACSSAQQDLVYGAPFAEFFAGEWGALGTDWPVNSGFADVFGQRILSMILKDQISLRDALRRASDETAQDSNYLPLIYAVYGLSTVRFVDPHPAG